MNEISKSFKKVSFLICFINITLISFFIVGINDLILPLLISLYIFGIAINILNIILCIFIADLYNDLRKVYNECITILYKESE